MRGLLPASAAALIILLAAAQHSVGDPRARAAAANSFQVTATDATPPDRVGRQVYVRIQGAIVANSKKLVPRRCRAERQITIFNQKFHPPTATNRMDLQPTPRSGRFNGVIFPYEYGGLDEDGNMLSGDIPFSGGTLTLQVVVAKSTVYGKDFTKPITCKPFARTVTVPVPPAAGA